MRHLFSGVAVAGLLGCGGCHSSHSVESPAPSTSRSTAAPAKRVTPFLMFQDGRAEEAILRYVEVFRDARVVFMTRYAENAVGAKVGSVQQAVFEIYGQPIMVTESPIRHPFDFTPAVSLFVDFDSEEELNRVFAALSEGGMVMMPPANYGFSRRFAFIQDRYGVSWQLNLPSGEHR